MHRHGAAVNSYHPLRRALLQVRRRALALVAAAVKAAAEDGERAEAEGGAAGAPAGAGAQALAEAALAAVPLAVQLLAGEVPAGSEPVTALTSQAALGALGTLAGAYGASAPQPFLAAVPAVLAAAQDSRSAVRGSALACVAFMARALGPRLVPALPAVVRGVLSAAQSAAAAVVAPAAEAAEEEGEEGAVGPGGAAALELAASLAACSALVESVGAFLAPYLPGLLGVLLAPAVLCCHAAGCAEAAAAVRARVAEGVPPRLLLGPLLGQLDAAVEVRGQEGLPGGVWRARWEST